MKQKSSALLIITFIIIAGLIGSYVAYYSIFNDSRFLLRSQSYDEKVKDIDIEHNLTAYASSGDGSEDNPLIISKITFERIYMLSIYDMYIEFRNCKFYDFFYYQHTNNTTFYECVFTLCDTEFTNCTNILFEQVLFDTNNDRTAASNTFVYFFNCNNIIITEFTIYDKTIHRDDSKLKFLNSENITISNGESYKGGTIIELYQSNNTKILHNLFQGYDRCIYSKRTNLILTDNVFIQGELGLELWIEDETYFPYTYGYIARNSFDRNTKQVLQTGIANFNGTESFFKYTHNGKGNYWSDYKEKYSGAENIDGIWSIPYSVNPDGYSFDTAPLVKPISITTFTIEEHLLIIFLIIVGFVAFSYIFYILRLKDCSKLPRSKFCELQLKFDS